MRTQNRLVRWVVAIAALVAAYELYNYLTAPLTIAAAISDGKVDTQIAASGNDGNSATITLTRSSDASGTLTVVIPAGTMLQGSDPNDQRLITAVPVTFVLSDETPSVTQQVQAYCIDEFAVTPLDSASLSFAPDQWSGGSSTEEMEPLHKLADCLSSSYLSDSEKQLAVWATKDDWLNKSQDEAVQFVTDGLIQRMQSERHEQLVGKKPDLMRAAPSLSSERIDELIEAEYQNGMPELRNIAAEQASDQVKKFIYYDKSVLEACGYAVADMAIFRI